MKFDKEENDEKVLPKTDSTEGTFGIMKNDRWYKRIVRRGINSVKLEVLLVAIGHNLYKYQNKKMRNRTAA